MKKYDQMTPQERYAYHQEKIDRLERARYVVALVGTCIIAAFFLYAAIKLIGGI